MSKSVTPWTARSQASLSFTVSQSLLKLMSIESVMPSNNLILCCLLLLLTSIIPRIKSEEMSQLFVSAGQSIGASASASVLSVNIQDWFPLGLTGLISLLSKGLSRVFSQHLVQWGFPQPPICVYKVQGMTNYNSFSWHLWMVCFSYKLVEESSSSVQWYHLFTFQLA